MKTPEKFWGIARETVSQHGRAALFGRLWQRKYRLALEICAVVLIKLAVLMVLRHYCFGAPAAPDMRMAPADVAQALLSTGASARATISPRSVPGTKG